jgi:hypothetical protein
VRAATAAQLERFGERVPALAPVLPQARLTSEAFGVRRAPQQLQAIMGRLSVFFVLHPGASFRN